MFLYLKDGSRVEATAYKSQMTKEVALHHLRYMMNRPTAVLRLTNSNWRHKVVHASNI